MVAEKMVLGFIGGREFTPFFGVCIQFSTDTLAAMEAALTEHVTALRACRACAKMHAPPISGGAISSRVMLVGQAPGVREPALQRPFAWTAGKTLFRWFEEACGIGEESFRQKIYIAAVCRCFPGKAKSGGGDRVPDKSEIARCASWLQREFQILRPQLILPVGKLAIAQFLPAVGRLVDIIGQQHRIRFAGIECDVIPLPHPSGASTWHRSDPGKALTAEALRRVAEHHAFKELIS
jgi:uracil-DNA glycosylase